MIVSMSAMLKLHNFFIFACHCVESVSIRRFSGMYFPAFRLNTEREGVSLIRIQSECGKIRTRKTPNTDAFHVVCTSNLTCI